MDVAVAQNSNYLVAATVARDEAGNFSRGGLSSVSLPLGRHVWLFSDVCNFIMS